MALPLGRWATDADAYATLLMEAAEALRGSPFREGSVQRLPRRGTLLATGDVHDHPAHLEAILARARLDESSRRHVVLHELVHGDRTADGRDMSHRNLARVAELVLSHPLQVHPLLANHEIAQCRRQGIMKGGVDNLAAFDLGLEWAFGDDAEVAAEAVVGFIRSLPLALRCANGLLVAHSIPSPESMAAFDRKLLDRALRDGDLDEPAGSAYLMTWGRSHDPAHVARLADEWHVRTFVVGHVHAPEGAAAACERLLVLNSDHARGRVVEIDLEHDVPDAAVLLARSEPLRLAGHDGGGAS